MGIDPLDTGPLSECTASTDELLCRCGTSLHFRPESPLMDATPDPAGDPQLLLSSVDALPFDRIRPLDMAATAEVVLAEGEALLTALSSEQEGALSGRSLLRTLERQYDRLDRVYGLAHHFQSTCDSPAWRSAWAEVQPKITDFVSRWGQSRAVMKALETIALAHEPDRPMSLQRLLDTMLQSMRLAGVALEGEAADRFRAIQTELAASSTGFAQTALDSRKTWSHLIEHAAGVDGMPLNWRQLTAAQARKNGHEDATPEDGPWFVTLDQTIATPVLQHATDRSLRERIRRAWLRVGAEAPHDNSSRMARIVALRLEKARLLGFDTYADLSLATKMAESVDHVLALTDRVVTASTPLADQERASLQARAAAAGAPEGRDGLQAWDERFWSERDKEERVGLTDNDLRPYFAFDNALDGLFELVEHLLGVRFELADLPTWHPDVRAYRLLEADDNSVLATVYIDPYSRPETKRAGAWMMPLVGRSAALGADGAPRKPVAAICCNQSPPVDGVPSLMSFREVTTLFHEMGHAVHHLLAEADDVRQAGVSGVEWDAVELPSMFLDSWVYHRPTLHRLARHHLTGAPLPDDVIERLLAGRSHMGGGMLLAQAAYNRLDLAVHRTTEALEADAIHALANGQLAATRPLPPLPEDRMLCSFSHIFAGGYAAGYYSYMWAGVLARDAFAAFTELNGDRAAEARLGRRWRHEVLAPGGSVHPMKLFRRFRGRAPSEAAMLAWHGVPSPASTGT